jgi:predicted nuclease of predicted toxin-antitoxin system
MRLVANENVPGPVVAALRARGHDVLSVKESLRGAADHVVLARAQGEHRLVLTFDRDFGELAFRANLPAGSGVVLFRLSGPSPDADNARMLAALESRDDWPGHFSVVTDDRIRMRPLRRRPLGSAG